MMQSLTLPPVFPHKGAIFLLYRAWLRWALLAALPLLATCRPPARPADPPTSRRGMVVSAHPAASRAGLAVLQRGGNAFDATVATSLALAVVFPRAGNLGGGGFAVFRAADGTVGSLDYREKAPLAAGRDMYLDSAGGVVARLSIDGHLASGVPGTVAGMVAMHARYGKLPWREVVQPAIDLARNGVVLTAAEAGSYVDFAPVFRKFNADTTAVALLGRRWQAGDTLRQPDLAATLTRVRDQGHDGFYAGPTARLLVAEMERGGGLITAEDLRRYQAVWRTPVTGTYRGYRIISMPPPSSGGVALLQLLKGVERYPLGAWGHNTARTVHAMTEWERRVYADRATYLGDPDFFDVPVAMLLSPAYLQTRAQTVRMDQKTPSNDIKEGSVDRIESLETTHFSVVDSAGNGVSVTTTLNGYYGAKVMVAGAGFFLNNEMDDFSVKPGVANMFGLVGGEANAIAPGKRMLSSMTPTLVERDGALFMVVGTPGGSTIITTVFQIIVNVIDHGMTLPAALAAGRFHHQWLPDVVLVEKGAFSPAVSDSLTALGHVLKEVDHLGKVEAILVLPDGTRVGVAEPRGDDDSAAGY